MTPIKEFNKNSCDAIASLIEKELEALAEAHGVSIVRGRGTYTGPTFTLKLEIAVKNEDGTVVDRAAVDFTRHMEDEYNPYGLKPEHLGAEFTANGGTYVITGLKPRNRKMPIIASRKGTDSSYKFPAREVRKRLGIVSKLLGDDAPSFPLGRAK
tara:strand:+ start:29290 stop:29754 length:465 start_codon:yes stop_codon:yes gene_type:complete